MPETSAVCHLDIIAAYSMRGTGFTPSLEKKDFHYLVKGRRKSWTSTRSQIGANNCYYYLISPQRPRAGTRFALTVPETRLITEYVPQL